MSATRLWSAHFTRSGELPQQSDYLSPFLFYLFVHPILQSSSRSIGFLDDITLGDNAELLLANDVESVKQGRIRSLKRGGTRSGAESARSEASQALKG